ncbi:MAG: UDP-N-acetylmuramate dehydrogenase [Acidimicrobiia bacterium]|nr:UDP-N-acetylmuramate dehydrogenase [Acidimicrobiia bacterium]
MTVEHHSLERDVDLAPMTTYKVGGRARWFAEPDGLEDLRSLLEATPPEMPVFVLGRGSNVVISDSGFDGLVIRLGRGFSAIDVRPDGMIVAGAGVSLPILARTAAAAGRSGLEFYIGIPGSVGGAIRMNAGGHGSDTAAVLEWALIFDLGTREVSRRNPADLALSYRHSNLTDTDVVLQATYTTGEIDPEDAESVLREITRWRKEHQPGGTLNAGSVFKNPEHDAAGAIIDRLGLKGYRIGPVAVSDVHANWMVATKDATASDIFAFVHRIQAIVASETGIVLEPEIRFVGSFDHGDTGESPS